jgi:hypothetical protein
MKYTIDNQNVSEQEIKRLYQFNIYGRWLVVFFFWLLLIPWGLWNLRETISLCQDRCTWAAIRLGMEFNPSATVAISFCLGIFTAVLVKQSIHILKGGLSDQEKYYLAKKVQKIRHQGQRSLLYRWVYPSEKNKNR